MSGDELLIEGDPDFLSWWAAHAPAAPPSTAVEGSRVPAAPSGAPGAITWTAPPAPAPRVPIQPWQRQRVYATIARARDWGLRVPAFTVCFVNHEPPLNARTVLLFDRGVLSLCVELAAWLKPDDLRGSLCHELQHVADLARGSSLTPEEAESRADAFASKVTGRRERPCYS